jgi:ribonuclease HII
MKFDFGYLFEYFRKMLSARFKDDNMIEIGIDEAGRGSFWGPIMAGALIIPPESTWTDKQKTLLAELRDSKKITPKKRERIYDQIKELIPNAAVGIVSAKEINDNGITWANMEAFRRAVQTLSLTKEEQDGARLVIDGVLQIDEWGGEQELVVDGDAEYLAIAGASILAKVEHDKWITKYCEDNPECNDRYDLLKSKGYGTANHREGIRNYGAHELHRSLYVQNWLPGSTQKAKPRKKADKNQCLINFKV